MGRATPGRKRKAGKREPNGQLSRQSKHVQERRSSDEESTMSIGKQARQRIWGVSLVDAGTDLAGTAVGRLLLQGEITIQQHEAAKAMVSANVAYCKALELPRPPRAVAMGLPSGGSDHDISPERYRQAIDKWDAAVAALQEANYLHRSGALYAAVQYVVLQDQHHGHLIGDLRLGLNALARHFRVGTLAKTPEPA